MSESTSPHPDAEDLSAWVDCEGTAEELAGVEAHVAGCETCRARARTFGRTAQLVAALPRETADAALIARTVLVARASRAPRRGLAWTAVAAAGVVLGAFVTYRVVLVQQLAADAPAMIQLAERAPKKSDATAEVASAAAPQERQPGAAKLVVEPTRPQAPSVAGEGPGGSVEGVVRQEPAAPARASDPAWATGRAAEAEVAEAPLPQHGAKREAARNASAADTAARSPVDERRQEAASLSDATAASAARDEADLSREAGMAEPQAKAARSAAAPPPPRIRSAWWARCRAS